MEAMQLELPQHLVSSALARTPSAGEAQAAFPIARPGNGGSAAEASPASGGLARAEDVRRWGGSSCTPSIVERYKRKQGKSVLLSCRVSPCASAQAVDPYAQHIVLSDEKVPQPAAMKHARQTGEP